MPLLQERHRVRLARCLCYAVAVSDWTKAAPTQGWRVQGGGKLLRSPTRVPGEGWHCKMEWAWGVVTAEEDHQGTGLGGSLEAAFLPKRPGHCFQAALTSCPSAARLLA